MKIDLSGKTALVTGSTAGIGNAIAKGLAATGAEVVVNGRGQAKVDAAVAAIEQAVPGAKVRGIAADVSSAEGCRALLAALPEVDILVNNAGKAGSAPFDKTNAALWADMLASNLSSVFLVTHTVLPGMAQRGRGRVINVASTAGLTGYAYVSAYVAAKHGVVGLTRSLALEYARRGVTVNAVCPGYTDTLLVADAAANIVAKTGRSEQEARAALAKVNPMQRLVTPEEVADSILWLASEGASSINGQAVAVAGGEVFTG